MDSRASSDFLFSSDEEEEEEEEIFAGFTVEEIEQLREQQTRKEISVGEENNSSSENGEEIDSPSDVDVFVDEEEGEENDSEQSSEEQEATNAVHWSSTLSEINVEPFSIPHGPTKDLGPNAKSKGFFNLFIDDNFLDEMAANSIAYARSKGDANFTTTRYEISAFPGLNILIGIHSLPQVSMLWESDDFVASEGFKKTMPKHRFFTVSKYIHLSNPNNEDASDLLCKVRPLVTLLERKFAEAFVLGKNISVDEGLVKFNGRLSFKQYMPMRPNKFGIKVWLLADSDCYYIPRFQVYLGKNRTNSELFKGLGYYVVWTLGEPYLDANRHFYFENFFTSVDLVKSLHERNSYACGTVRLHRRDLPADLKRMKLVSGEIRTRQSGNLVVTLWRDKRVVSMLSTNVPPENEIHAVQQRNMRGRMKRVVPDDAKQKPMFTTLA
ncbi:piggyBac transposable element-derived protein 4-like [Montipora capricornis]|uniref:piggyBac transposable element-derived protein 4-like n=1 Tax=Montipora capricornis TaxID=246305 RepID=UPI0035F1495F